MHYAKVCLLSFVYTNMVWTALMLHSPSRSQFFQHSIIICFSNIYAEMPKRTHSSSLQNTPSSTNSHSHSHSHCAVRDQLLQIPISPAISLWVALTGRYLWAVQMNHIFFEGLYQNTRYSVMWQIIPCHKGSIIIVRWHMRVYSERPFLVFISDRMIEKKMW